MLKLADTVLILINTGPNNVKKLIYLNIVWAKEASPPMMWLVAAARNNLKTTVLKLDNSGLKL